MQISIKMELNQKMKKPSENGTVTNWIRILEEGGGGGEY